MVDQVARPFISVESVKTALDLLLYTTSNPEANPLEHLLLVDHFLANPDFPRTSLDRNIAVKHILVDCITDALAQQRHLTQRESPAVTEDIAQQIRQDGASQNPELIGWSVLFYRYVRVELNLSLEKYSHMAYLEARTTRRYQAHSITRLTERLIQLEWEMRAFYRQMRLQAALPSLTPVHLFGRDELFATAESLFTQKHPQHIQVTGLAGIGKTTFVQEFVRQQIEQGLVDELVWLNQPRSVQQARYQLVEELARENMQLDLRQYTLLNRLYVVIDEADLLKPLELKDLLLDLSSACVFIISRQPVLLNIPIQHLPLTELNDQAAVEMIQSLADADHDITDSYAAYIWQMLGGNPLVIRLTINNLSLKHPDFLDKTALEQVFDQTFDSLTDDLQAAWVICALHPLGDIDVMRLLDVWSGFVKQEAVAELLKRKLLEKGYAPLTLRMVLSARNYLKNSSKHSAKVKDLISQALEYLTNQLPVWQNETYELMEHILISEWPVLTDSQYDLWVRSLVETGISRGRYLTWLSILEAYPSTLQDTHLCFHYARVLRLLSVWDKSHELLENVIAGYGQQGQFREQGRALLELGILLRQKGAYAEALRVFDKADKIASRFKDVTLQRDLKLEFAQIAIDQHDISLFRTVTGQLPVTVRLMSMQISVCLALGSLDQALELAQAILETPDITVVSTGRTHATIGRIYEQKGDYEQAAQHLGQAITILEQERDRYALARAQSNLGAVLTHLKVYDEAGELLKRAQHIQQILGDRTGLAATQHNMIILRQQQTAH